MEEPPVLTAASVGGGNRHSDAGALYTSRLALLPMSCEVMRAIMATDWAAATDLLGTGFPSEWCQDGWSWLRPRVSEGEQDPLCLAWGTRLGRVVNADGSIGGPIIVEAGFHGPPDGSRSVEIGYRVVERCRRRGFAEEAVSGLLAWASLQGVTAVTASIGPDNVASAMLVRKLGFTETGSYRHDQLGNQRIFRRECVSSRSRKGTADV